MPEEMNLEDLYEWAAENLDEITEDVQTILHDNPNRFVSVREIAGKLGEIAGKPHWPFKGYEELEWVCFIAVCSREYDHDSEWLEYKYKGEITDEDRPGYIQEYEEKLEKFCRKARDEVLREFKMPRQRRELEEQDKRMEEVLKQLLKIQNEERDIREDI